MRTVTRAIVGVVLLAVVVGAGWLYRERIRTTLAGPEETANAPASSAELAAAARTRIAAVATGDAPGTALSQDEVRALLRHVYAGLLPSYIDSLRVELAGDRVHVAMRIPKDRIPQAGELGPLVLWLPDTTQIAAIGRLVPFTEDRVAIAIAELQAATIPVPPGLIPAVLTSLGRKDEPGLAADALAVPLPQGIRAAYVRADSLVLLGRATPNLPN